MKLRRLVTKPRLLVLLLLLSVATSLAGERAGEPLRRLVRVVLEPLTDGGVYLATVTKSRLASAGRRTISQEQARKLAEENLRLRGLVGGLTQRLERERQRRREIQGVLSHLYRPNRDVPSELIPAKVVTMDPMPYNATRVLDRGGAEGARAGLPVTTRGILTNRAAALPAGLAVITASALVGRLTETDAYTARLQLLTDPAYRVPVKIRRLVDARNPRTITVARDGRPTEEILTPAHPDVEVSFPGAKGDGAGGMIVEDLKALHNVRPGDLVYTRAADLAVGAEIPVGQVVRVVEDLQQPGFVTVHIEPHADLASLREVYIVVPPRGGFAASGERR